MKKIVVPFLVFSILITSCAPSSAKIAAALAETQQAQAQTQQAQAQNEAAIQTGIAQTLAAAVTNTPMPTNTPSATNTPELPVLNTEPPTGGVYLSPVPTLKLEITLETKNRCDTTVTVKVTGLVSYTYTLGKDEIDKHQLPRGTYSFSDSKGHKWSQTFNTPGTFTWVLCRNS